MKEELKNSSEEIKEDLTKKINDSNKNNNQNIELLNKK